MSRLMIRLLVTASLSQALGLGFAVDGFWAAFWGGLIVGITSTVLGLLTPPTTPAKR